MTALAPPERRPAPPLRTGSPRRPFPLHLAVPAVLIGVAVTGAGAGLGIRHLQKVGWSATTLLGFLLLAAGIALLWLGFRALWRAGRRWWRLLILSTAVLLLVPLWAVLFAVMATVVPQVPLGEGTPSDRGLAYSDAAMTTDDGVRLSGWWVPSRNGAGVVLLHGAGSTRTATLPQAEVLARLGYGVLMLDARGHGRSEGRGMDLGWYGDADIRAAVDYVVRAEGVTVPRVALVGLSMGGEQAIGATLADPRIAAVVAEGVTARTAADKADWLPGGVAGGVQRAVDRFVYAVVDLLTPAAPPTSLRDAVSRSDASYLVIAGGRMPDEARAARVLRDAAPARVQVWDVPGADHTRGLATDARQWESRVAGFLRASLLSAG